ncbi:TPA: hypothetical protein DEQ22_00515 [Candidatus Nomurabacteria bacterium]|uniref:Uncharacterized protein n=2 Tax=Candidatus Nomuraibacteriota TaxID=1752729 RepID=A0A1F6YM35_9BACT|nr:MAG: hypothetical protein UV13_C0001G0053 [Parcubacteria group bacterium GW2011_GWC1_42_21]KKS58710.1 MAG: hypothetical protein UV23_C0002G0035 [Candidatus Nomurabacteria bacterium GW2011_GWF1_42_40]KKT00727.1 MAG: hypothetical protein UV77_C0001G0098 [Candidatus Nomurabacteria bacterium GW2011_GWA1_43_17]KKT07925.1 MAG: hypothetical protein UV85_C0003G0050 [Candidatus Nomurabacteria bacterium GW2011_GWB1_43_19]KKT11886.1 MAG: hypothetical protein UV91_C0001G0098 [Candidatus Nomurabacteria b
MKKLDNNQKGISIIGVLVLAVIIILVLSYFNISIKAVVESPTGQENINYVAGGTKSLWTAYLAEPVSYLWNDVWIDIFWKGFISNMERIRDGQPTDFDKAGDALKLPQ